ncbi:serine/threonine-protein kinase [Streptomyces sp. LMG1-1-1.1]|uniref:serine/threonine-protein kinase n=1 Tax=Streptomyces sp. LMG1-1-1.1 TaxID=3135245 RepID=UPI0034657C2E
MQVRARPVHPDVTWTARTVAGRYRIARLLGRGGAADVYEALDLRLRRPVAVKVFRPTGARRTDAQCDEEARLLARMHHPGLVTLYDTGRDESRPFLVMQLVRGTTLRQRIARGVLTPAETCRTGAALASALTHVHAHGVVHRDVKPSNILLDRSDTPLLTDFGISRRVHAADDAPEGAGTLVGTASYMAPEQALGRKTGPAADVYSLGLVLLETLKGEAEYGGTPLEAALAHLHRPPVLPSGLPTELARLLTAMTDRSPEARPDAATCARVLADPRTAERTSTPSAAPGSREAGVRGSNGSHGANGSRGASGSHRSHRSPRPRRSSAARPGRSGAGRAVAATLVTLGLTLTGSLGSAPAGEAAPPPRDGASDGSRTSTPASPLPKPTTF